jgi:hypothetical protein
MTIRLSLCMLFFLVFPISTWAVPTPFEQAIDRAIENGLHFLRTNEFELNGNLTESTGLTLLSFMESRSAPWNSPRKGYIGLDPNDQGLMQLGIKNCINGVAGFLGGGSSDSYRTGSCLMALSVYLKTGGPNQIDGVQITVDQAIQNAVQALTQNQGHVGSNQGGWSYTTPESDGDLSTSHLAMNGLSAASTIIPNAHQTLMNAIPFINNTKTPDGGHTYRPQTPNTGHSMTAVAGFVYRLAQLPTNDMSIQSALNWLKLNYTYDQLNIYQEGIYYYLWSSTKAFLANAQENNMIGGLRNPANDGYPEEMIGWKYDFAYFLIQNQSADGGWCGNTTCWSANRSAATAMAILTLVGSLGGACVIDVDLDGLCDQEDNCPTISNADQSDIDMDRIGDVCDNCMDQSNTDQIDIDVDGIGDICDDSICIPGGQEELCDGFDNNCDGIVDDDAIDCADHQSCLQGQCVEQMDAVGGTQTAGTQTAGTQTAGTQTAGTQTAGTQTAGTDTQDSSLDCNTQYDDCLAMTMANPVFIQACIDQKSKCESSVSAKKSGCQSQSHILFNLISLVFMILVLMKNKKKI